MSKNYFGPEILSSLNDAVAKELAEKDVQIEQLEAVIAEKDKKISDILSLVKDSKCAYNTVIGAQNNPSVLEMYDPTRESFMFMEEFNNILDKSNFVNLFIPKWESCETMKDYMRFFDDIYNLLGIEKTNTDLKYEGDKIKLIKYLSYVYYDHQDVLAKIIAVLGDKCTFEKEFVRLGRDYDKENLIKSLKHNVENEPTLAPMTYSPTTFTHRMAYKELFLNKHILDDDVMSYIYVFIEHRIGGWQNLLFIFKYRSVSPEVINKMFNYINITIDDIDTHAQYMVIDFLRSNFKHFTVENQSKIISLMRGYCKPLGWKYDIVDIRSMREGTIFNYLNSLEINIAIDKMSNVFGYNIGKIINYILTERPTDISAVKIND